MQSRRLGLAVALAIAVSSATLGLGANPAAATPQTDLASATQQATKLEQKILANAKQADILDERYLQARTAVQAAVKEIAATQAQIDTTEASARRLRDQLGGRAALLYMGAGNQDPVGVDVASVQELGAMAQYGAAAAAPDQRILDMLQRTDAQLAAQHDDLDGQLAAAQDRQRAVQSAQRAVEAANASTQHLLDTTNANIKLLAATIEQQAAAAAADAERAWLKREAQRQAKRAAPGPGASVGAPDPGSVDAPPPSALPAPTSGAWKAVAYARAQLGKPYVYAGAGPDVFDCSGLTMMAWAQAGVAMEHGSQSQYDSFPHVPIDQLRPGDLVFFGDTGPTNHHVGIVVGPGVMIDAPHTGAFVETVSYFQPDLVPLGARP